MKLMWMHNTNIYIYIYISKCTMQYTVKVINKKGGDTMDLLT